MSATVKSYKGGILIEEKEYTSSEISKLVTGESNEDETVSSEDKAISKETKRSKRKSKKS